VFFIIYIASVIACVVLGSKKQRLILGLIFGVILGPIGVIAMFFIKPKTAESLVNKSGEEWLSKLDGCQYKHFYNGTGIALDNKNKSVFIVDLSEEKKYDYSDVREWKYNISTGGHLVGSTGLQGSLHNVANARKNESETGFFISVRDIEHPQWRIKFRANADRENELLKWMEIMNQHINNE
jgi:hypothetical protein